MNILILGTSSFLTIPQANSKIKVIAWRKAIPYLLSSVSWRKKSSLDRIIVVGKHKRSVLLYDLFLSFLVGLACLQARHCHCTFVSTHTASNSTYRTFVSSRLFLNSYELSKVLQEYILRLFFASRLLVLYIPPIVSFTVDRRHGIYDNWFLTDASSLSRFLLSDEARQTSGKFFVYSHHLCCSKSPYPQTYSLHGSINTLLKDLLVSLFFESRWILSFLLPYRSSHVIGGGVLSQLDDSILQTFKAVPTLHQLRFFLTESSVSILRL